MVPLLVPACSWHCSRLQDVGPILPPTTPSSASSATWILRALGDQSITRPSSGSFVSAPAFYDKRRMCIRMAVRWLNRAMTAVAELPPISLSTSAGSVGTTSSSRIFPSEACAFIVVIITVALNLISVKLFGELEFWSALIKILALLSFTGGGYLVPWSSVSPSTASPWPEPYCSQ